METKEGRAGHFFRFSADQNAQAASDNAEYHERRVAYWQDEQRGTAAIVAATAKVEIKEEPITGGNRIQVVVSHGDPGAYVRMQEAFGKWQFHRALAARYRIDASLYGSQERSRIYDLKGEDVAYFRLDGRQPDV